MTEVPPGSIRAWILAARPATLTAAFAPVAATSRAMTDGSETIRTPSRPTGPEKPCEPPVISSILASEASWR